MKVHVLFALTLFLLSACSRAPAPEAVPETPTGLSATPGDGQVSLVWQASEEEVARYVVRVEATGDLPEDLRVAAPSTGTTVNQLTNDKGYSFRVAAETEDQQRSAFSDAVTATPKAPPPPGGGEPKPEVATPTGLTVNAGDAMVTVTWQPNGGKRPEKLHALLGQRARGTRGDRAGQRARHDDDRERPDERYDLLFRARGRERRRRKVLPFTA